MLDDTITRRFSMLRSFIILAALAATPAILQAQELSLSGDAAAAVAVALRYARHDLIGSRKHVSVNRVQDELGRAWTAAQVAAFREVLAESDSARTGVELCDSRRSRCRADDESEVVSVYPPAVMGDSVTVVIQRVDTRSWGPPRTRYSLRGHQYTLVRHGRTWKVVRTDLVLVT
jgi:hypothetical protein